MAGKREYRMLTNEQKDTYVLLYDESMARANKFGKRLTEAFKDEMAHEYANSFAERKDHMLYRPR